MSTALAQLRQQLAAILAPARAGEPALSTGIAALDGALQGGVPRGRVTELVGMPGSGTTTLVRRLVETTATLPGAWVAYVDATRTLAPRDWAHLGACGVWMVRPREPARAAWCADVLLRSGAFALVVLDGAPPMTGPVAVRLDRLAREQDVALLVRRDLPTTGSAPATLPNALPSALRLRVAPARAPERLLVQVERGGAPHRVEVGRRVEPPARLLRHEEPADRRGVARGARGRGGRGRARA